MLLLRALLIATLSLLGQNAKIDQSSSHITTYYSPLLDSLKCTNDYTTHIRCTWEEDLHTQTPTPISSDGSPCVPVNHSVLLPNGKIQRSCIYKTGVFIRGEHSFFFNTSCPSKALKLNISTHGKVLAPINLTEGKINGGDRLLRWSSPYSPSSNLTQMLTYQVKYRIHGHDWTIKMQIKNSELQISHSGLLPGYSYEARVRARGKVGKWSDWSPSVTWMTEEENVLNLQCVIKEDGVMCNWQVKRENAQFLYYYLCRNATETLEECNLCANHNKQPYPEAALLDFTCSVQSSEPELLNVEIRTVYQRKDFSDPENIQPPRMSPVHVCKQKDLWKLNWTRPNVSSKLKLIYQVRLTRKDTHDDKLFTLTEGDFILDVPPSSLIPSTGYMTQVRAVPGKDFNGQPSDWSEPTYFTSDPASWINIIIYTFIGVFVTVLSLFLYNALPACHRRVELWKVSIPSPFNSKVLEEMNTKKSLAGIVNLYSDCEKTSVCIIETSDNPIICKGSISEYPILSCNDVTDGGFSMIKSGYLHSLSQLSSFTDDSRVTDKSGIRFIGPYILCQESSVSTETSDMVFSSLSSFDEDNIPIFGSVNDSSPMNKGYVLSPPTTLQSSCFTQSNPVNENREIPSEDPPAYTPTPAGMPGAIFSHSSGYCRMPNMEMNISAWASASNLSLDGAIKCQSNQTEDSCERGYVTLSQR